MHGAISGGELLSPIDGPIGELDWLEMHFAVSREAFRHNLVSITIETPQCHGNGSKVLQID
jgi:hypothetical protein